MFIFPLNISRYKKQIQEKEMFYHTQNHCNDIYMMHVCALDPEIWWQKHRMYNMVWTDNIGAILSSNLHKLY